MTPQEKQSIKNKENYTARRAAIVSGLGPYATYKDRTIKQWLNDLDLAREYLISRK